MSKRRAGDTGADTALFRGVDLATMIRGASLGFSVLVLGGLVAPLAARLPVLGPVWLPVVAAVAFALAGSRIGVATAPARHGGVAAVSAYLLVVPLVMMAPVRPEMPALGLSAGAAVLVGALAGAVAARRRG